MNRTFFAVCVLATAAAGLLLTACSDPPTPAAKGKPVFVTTVSEAVSSQTRSFTSVVRARVETDLGFRTGGKVVDRLVEVGEAVKAGQALARLDPADYQLAVSAAADQVQAASARAFWRSWSALPTEPSVSRRRMRASSDAACCASTDAACTWSAAALTANW